jgi:ribosomal protein S6--L-glutamate ligase
MVISLGVRPNFADYTDAEKTLIVNADKIYYPSSFYSELFHAMGKPTFPSLQTYAFAQDKIKQTALFNLVGINHPRTRVFYGKKQKTRILAYFSFPFIAKIPRGSALGRGIFLIRTPNELAEYCRRHGPAYIQEYFPIDRDIRVVVIGGRVVHAYWRIARKGCHCANIAAGGQVDLSPVPDAAQQLALDTAHRCNWDDVGIDICMHKGEYYVLEGNMKYGREGFRHAGKDYPQLMSELIKQGVI